MWTPSRWSSRWTYRTADAGSPWRRPPAPTAQRPAAARTSCSLLFLFSSIREQAESTHFRALKYGAHKCGTEQRKCCAVICCFIKCSRAEGNNIQSSSYMWCEVCVSRQNAAGQFRDLLGRRLINEWPRQMTTAALLCAQPEFAHSIALAHTHTRMCVG